MSDVKYLARETCLNCPEEVGATEMHENFGEHASWSFRWRHTGTGEPRCANGSGRYAASGRRPTAEEIAAWQGPLLDTKKLAGKLRFGRPVHDWPPLS